MCSLFEFKSGTPRWLRKIETALEDLRILCLAWQVKHSDADWATATALVMKILKNFIFYIFILTLLFMAKVHKFPFYSVFPAFHSKDGGKGNVDMNLNLLVIESYSWDNLWVKIRTSTNVNSCGQSCFFFVRNLFETWLKIRKK